MQEETKTILSEGAEDSTSSPEVIETPPDTDSETQSNAVEAKDNTDTATQDNEGEKQGATPVIEANEADDENVEKISNESGNVVAVEDTSTANVQSSDKVTKDENEEDEIDEDDAVGPIPLGYLINEEGVGVPYPGVFSLFLTDTTLERVDISDLSDDSPVPFRKVPKEVILKDISFRGKISDFQIIKADIEKSSLETLMVRVNTDNIYGDDNNYELATTQEVCDEWELIHDLKEKQKRLDAEASAKGVDRKKKKKKREKKVKMVPIPKEWVTLGSDLEIENAKIKPSRDKISVSFARTRREFNQSLEFTDKDAQELWNGSQMECRPYKDIKFDLQRMEFDVGCQCVGLKQDKEVQATRLPLVNKSTQYEARISDASETYDILEKESFQNFLESVIDQCDDALQQNEVVNIFEDDFATLADEDSAPGNRSENNISEYQSFTHLTYSKNKLVSSIDWLPNRRGIVAVACTEPLSFDERISVAGRVRTSAILIWNFKDPIHPQCVLESPSDVMCFKFCEQSPDLVAGGMYNGQVILWDMSQMNKQSKKGMSADGDEEGLSIPVIKCKFLSAIESSHTYPISDLCWMQTDTIVDSNGELIVNSTKGRVGSTNGEVLNDELSTSNDTSEPTSLESSSATSASRSNSQVCRYMFLTTAADGRVLFWDTLPKKDSKKGDVVWQPKYSIRLSRLEKGGNLGCVKLSVSSGTKFFCSSHDGEVAYADFSKSENVDYPDYTKHVADAHFGPVSALERSPFFPDILLSVGDWTFKLWKEGMWTPIYSSPCSGAYLTTGCWSPTRPGVIYTARVDGVLEVWDLLDRSHEPSMIVSASSAAITAVEFLKEKDNALMTNVNNNDTNNPNASSSNTSNMNTNASLAGNMNPIVKQRLAIGDRQGVLHIMDLPRNLRKAAVGEKQIMNAFFEREQKRVDSMMAMYSNTTSGTSNRNATNNSSRANATGGGANMTSQSSGNSMSNTGTSNNMSSASNATANTTSANSLVNGGPQSKQGMASTIGESGSGIDARIFDMEQQEEEYLKLERDFINMLGIEKPTTLNVMNSTHQATEIQAI